MEPDAWPGGSKIGDASVIPEVELCRHVHQIGQRLRGQFPHSTEIRNSDAVPCSGGNEIRER